MESPAGVATNVHKIDDVEEFDWILCVSDSNTAGPVDDGLGISSLRSAECRIRSDGRYVYLEARISRLWVFYASKQSNDQDGDDSKDFASTHRLIEIARGSIRGVPSDIPIADPNAGSNRVKRKRSDDAEEFSKLNLQAVSQNSSIQTPLNGENDLQTPIDEKYARRCLLKAARMSCLDVLTKSQHYLSIGDRLFCSRYQPSNSLASSKFRKQKSGMKLWSLEAFWHVDGALLICYKHLNDRVIRHPDLEKHDEQVILAPFGWLAKTGSSSEVRMSSSNDATTQRFLGPDSMWRTRCLNIFRHHGLQFQSDIQWIVISIPGAQPDDPENILEWPQELCVLISEIERIIPSVQPRQPPGKVTWKDPLSEASEWLEDWKARDKAIKEQQQARSRTDAHNKFQANEEVPLHLQSRCDEPIDPHALAGIYPTPPDAGKAHGILHIDGSAHIQGHSEDSDAMDIKDDPTSYSNTGLDASVDVGNYDPLKDEDLFADMEGEMDGENGVTEDDFRFFDEPDETESPLVDEIQANAIHDETAKPDIPEATDQLVESPANISNNGSRDVEMVEPPEEDETIPSHKHKVQIVSSPIIRTYEDTATESEDMNAPQSLDQKYGATGKFASLNGQHPSMAKPGISVQHEKTIPLVQNSLLLSPSSGDSPSSESSPSHEIGQLPARIDNESNSLLQNNQDFDSVFNSRSVFDGSRKIKAIQDHGDISSTSISPKMLENQGHGFIQLAQLVADQSVYYKSLTKHHQIPKTNGLADESNAISHTLTQSLNKCHSLSLQECAGIGSNPELSDSKGYTPSLLSTSVIRVKRGGSNIDMSFAAMEYWKELGINPLNDTKNVTAFCLYPDTEEYRLGAVTFLQNVSDTYRSLSFGTHSLGDPILQAYNGGLVPVPGLESLAVNTKAQEAFCNQFGKSISGLNNSQSTILLYMVRPENNTSFMDLCALFQRIFESYASMFQRLDQPNDVVLQIIPSTLVLSGLEHALPRLKQYADISKIVYNRCPLTEPASSPYASGSMIQLSEPLPTTLDFKLSSDSSVSPLGISEAFHLAYSYSPGSRWLSTALINAFGSKQWNASYYLGESKDIIFILSAVAQEIFEIIQNAAEARKSYSLFMVKTCRWTTLEIDIWTQLAHKAKIPLFMVVYDSQCPLELLSSHSELELNPDDLFVLPPTPDVSSPDAVGGKSEEQDSNSRLVDPSNEAWWISCKENLSIENGCLTAQKNLASAYVIYKDHSLVALSIQHSTHVAEITSIVETYHGLRTLAKARCVDDNLPWHLATAEAAQHGIEQCMNGTSTV